MQLTLLVAILVPFVELAARATADPIVPRNPLVRVPIKKRFNAAHPGTLKPAQRDLIRSSNLLGRVKRCNSSTVVDGIANVPLTMNDHFGVHYAATFGVGRPPTFYDFIVDTASSNTWVGANKHYKNTSSSVKTSDTVNLTYGSGFMIGTEYNDSVTIAPGVIISRQSIGVASNFSRIYPFDGILGIGPPGLTNGTLSPSNTTIIPTVTDNLYEEGLIEQKLIAVSLEPWTSAVEKNGELTFGGTDSTKFVGDINYVPITNTHLSSLFWGIDASFKYGSNTQSVTILSTTAGIVDTATSQLGLATDAYNKYINATGAVHDNSTGLLRIPKEQYNNLESLFFEVDGISYELTPNAQIWPRALNVNMGGTDDFLYLVVSDNGPSTGTLDFIVGMVVLERLYSVFDTTNRRVGFATTQFTNPTTN